MDRQTHFRIGYTKKALFIGVFCLEPHPDKLVVRAKDGDPAIGKDDNIMVHLHPDGAETYHRFRVGAGGARWRGDNVDGLFQRYVHLRRPPVPLGNWQTRTFKGDRYYSVEIKIPFETLGRTMPASGDIWSGNVYRQAVADQPVRGRWWSQNHGMFIFVGTPTTLADRQALTKTALSETEQLLRNAVSLQAQLDPARQGQLDSDNHSSLQTEISLYTQELQRLQTAVSKYRHSYVDLVEANQLLIASKKLLTEGRLLAKRVLLRQMLASATAKRTAIP